LANQKRVTNGDRLAYTTEVVQFGTLSAFLTVRRARFFSISVLTIAVSATSAAAGIAMRLCTISGPRPTTFRRRKRRML